VLVTNQPYLAVLAKDCPNTRSKRVHDHLTIGFDKDLRTADVSAYSKGWCRAYASAFREFVNDPIDKRCVHCLPQGESKTIYHRREMVRRCAEAVGLGNQVDALACSFDVDHGEVFMVLGKQKLEPTVEVESGRTHLGARCEQAPPSFSFSPTVTQPASTMSPSTRGSESYERAVKALRSALRRCGDPLLYRRGEPRPLVASAGAASREVLPHVAVQKQREALERLKSMGPKLHVVKWPIEEAVEIATMAEKMDWPDRMLLDRERVEV